MIETNDMSIIHELHIISAHLLHYASLLEDFRKSVQFVLDTRNPAMDGYEDNIKERDRKLLEKECNILLSQIERLEAFRDIQNMRLKNVMDLVSLGWIFICEECMKRVLGIQHYQAGGQSIHADNDQSRVAEQRGDETGRLRFLALPTRR